MRDSVEFKGRKSVRTKELPSKLLFLLSFQSFPKKDEFFCKKRLRVLFGMLRTPFTGGAEALDGTPDGAAGLTRLVGSLAKRGKI